MNTYCSIDNYLKHNHREFRKLLGDCCIDISTAQTLLIPSEAVVKKYKVERKNADKKKFADLSKKLTAHMIFQNLLDKQFMGGDSGNKLQQLIRLTAPKNGVLEMHTGPDFKTVAKLKIIKDFEPRLGMKGDQIPISVAEIEGDIAIDGKSWQTRSSAPGPRTIGQRTARARARGRGEDDIIGGSETKRKNYEILLAQGENHKDHGHCPFVSTIGGLLAWLQTEKNMQIPEYDTIRKRIASLVSYDAVGMYFAIIQPFSDNSFLTNDIINEWSFAQKESSDFPAIWQDFANKFCPSSSDRSTFLESRGDFVSQSTPLTFIDIYNSAVPKVFDGVISPEQKLWADELLFISYMRCHRGDNSAAQIREFGELVGVAHPGNNYIAESLYSSEDYWRKFGNSQLDGENGPVVFHKSEFFLKHTIVDDSNICKEIITKCTKSPTKYSIAFREINPL
jgi:hypothetical protein